ncbi:MAG: M28 family peptidase [Chitinophagales bacterium]|nr:M28 family peptidase [Chitinophagales bacterium]
MNKTKKFSILLLAVFVLGGISFFLSQCKSKTNDNRNDSDNQPSEIKNPPSEITAPDFNADSAYHFVEQQVAFGPRIPGTPSQTKCATWITDKLKTYTPTVYVQDLKVELWNHQMVPCINIIASFNPNEKKRILLCAHWDTRPWSDRDPVFPKKSFDGADDGGSGAAVLLEIARQLQIKKPNVGVDIVFFDVEDYGPPEWDQVSNKEEVNGYCLGTQEWASEPHVKDYRAFYGILLDMVGAKDATFPQEGVSLQYAPTIVQHVWDAANSLGYGNYFVYTKGPSIIDDHSFINSINQTPTIDIINLNSNSNYGFANHWHTQQDNMSIIDKNTLKAVGVTVLQVVYTEPIQQNQ